MTMKAGRYARAKQFKRMLITNIEHLLPSK